MNGELKEKIEAFFSVVLMILIDSILVLVFAAAFGVVKYTIENFIPVIYLAYRV